MRILGVDPSFTATGLAIIEKKEYRPQLLYYSYLTLKADKPLAMRVGIFYEQIDKIITEHSITHISLETPFLGKNVQAFLKLGYLRGIIHLLAHQKNLILTENAPRQIKAAVTGTGSASKDQVAFVVKKLFPQLLTAKIRHDITDAIAIAFCGLLAESRDQQVQKRYLLQKNT